MLRCIIKYVLLSYFIKMNKTVNVKNITLISMGIALNVVGAFIALNLRLPI